MVAKRIIPCLDVCDGRTVKGVNFVNLTDAGNPVELATAYSQNGADELVFLDISATYENRSTLIDMVEDVAKCVRIPFTVGGGISSVEAASAVLHAGADKIAINSAALKQPSLIDALAKEFGNQCVVLAIDAKFEHHEWSVYLAGGRKKTTRSLLEWAKEGQDRGVGEVLFTSMDHDGTKNGFAIDGLFELTENLSIPVIASGGAGNPHHFIEVFHKTNVDAALAASVFHYGEITIPELKNTLLNHKILVRL